jgi:hypothetical protein
MTDSPGLPLPSYLQDSSLSASDGERAEIFGATTYLIWSPNADSSYTDGAACTVPVPLGSLSWNWQGGSINTVVTNGSNTTWVPECQRRCKNPHSAG